MLRCARVCVGVRNRGTTSHTEGGTQPKPNCDVLTQSNHHTASPKLLLNFSGPSLRTLNVSAGLGRAFCAFIDSRAALLWIVVLVQAAEPTQAESSANSRQITQSKYVIPSHLELPARGCYFSLKDNCCDPTSDRRSPIFPALVTSFVHCHTGCT